MANGTKERPITNTPLIELSSHWQLDAVGSLVTDSVRESDQSPDVHLAQSRCRGIPFQIPGDVHSALLESGLIEDPYYRDNEFAVDWINQTPWQISRYLYVDFPEPAGHTVLLLEGIDCIATVELNGQIVGQMDNQFVRYAFDISRVLVNGENSLIIRFSVARDVAQRRAEQYPIELPGRNGNSRIDNNNFLRKTPCHSGWDWNICLMPVGVYGRIGIGCYASCRLDDVRISQIHEKGDVKLRFSIGVRAYIAATVSCKVQVADKTIMFDTDVYPGTQYVEATVIVQSADLWWPAGHGAQTTYPIEVSIADQHWQASVGLRQSRIVQASDVEGPGSGFAIEINGRLVFMRGANWIPPDALPARGTPESVRELLQSAVDVHMNMIRVWGGGQYEPDWFYELCDELGVMVWHDFMFSCNHYPAADVQWISSVRQEVRQQVRRLSRFACIALWCGDNELVGALNWWEVTLAHRDRYLANYVRLNTALEEIVAAEVPDIPWWPSSPSQGIMDYADGWKSDVAGDMHFWDVWHEAKPFSAYQEIRPRFCSEFGFQSFPSMPVIKSFSEPADQNVSSGVMAVHQRNIGGNARIVETLVRHFRFPDSFERTLFLSQCQQAMAITTAVEYWRSLKPRCMGTLFWQLNDTWPVASWSSLEYGGGWKLLHYAARRFYQDVLMVIVPVDREGQGERSPLALRAVNDSLNPITLEYEIRAIDMDGKITRRWTGDCMVGCDSAVDALTMQLTDVPDGCFLQAQWNDTSTIANDDKSDCRFAEYWAKPYKSFDLPKANVIVIPDADGKRITLATDKPAFFVSLELGGRRIWSDNGFTLLPDQPRTLTLDRTLDNPRVPESVEFSVEHLGQ